MRIHHIAFRTADLPRLEAFYRDVLELSVLARKESGSVWLDASGTILMLEARHPDEPAVPPGAMDLVAFAIDAAVGASFVARLSARSVAIEARTDATLYFRDPDGRRIAVSAFPEALTGS
jgi:catechol 2,3-dioxygenase-like lactoylglutathione lyase family enzyme